MTATIISELECARLAIAWARFVDLHDNDAVVALFADDGVLHAPGGGEIAGHPAILAALATRSANRVTRHMLAPPLVTMKGADEAHGVICFTVFDGFKDTHEGTGPMPLQPPVTVGEFHQTYRRTEQGWRIASHRNVQVFKQP